MLPVLEFAVSYILAREFPRLFEQLVVRKDRHREGKRCDVVERLTLHAEKVPEGGRAVRDSAGHRVRVEPVVLRHRRGEDRLSEVVRVELEGVALGVLIHEADTLHEDVSTTGEGRPWDTCRVLRSKLSSLSDLQLLLLVADSLEVVLAVNTIAGAGGGCFRNRDNEQSGDGRS